MVVPRRSPLALSLPLAALVAAGCGPKAEDDSGSDDTTGSVGPTPSGGTGDPPPLDGLPLMLNKDVDVLFVVDNSGSMGEEQAKLAAGFEQFVSTLEHPEVEANYRIGFTTTDNGNPWCQGTGPEAGSLRLISCRSRPSEFMFDGAQTIDFLQEACHDVCPEQWSTIEIEPTALFTGDEARPRTWLESIEGQTNLPEGLSTTQALQCFGPQGIDGCGFESHLESMWKALRRSTTQDDDDFGFVRDHAVLSIIHVTDEADCSYNSDWETIFLPDGDRVFWSDPDAISPTSAVCWNAGVSCTGSGVYDDCVAVNLDADGFEVADANASDDAVLRPLSRYVDFVQEFEDTKQRISPDQEVLVAVLGGVGPDGSIVYQDSMSDAVFQNDFGIGPGCVGSGGPAVPPVRLAEFAAAFQVGGQTNLFSICDDGYGSALEAIATSIAAQLPPACMPACVADADPTTPEVVDPLCTISQQAPTGDGSIEETIIPPCNGDSIPDGENVCYQALVGDALDAFCDDLGFNLQIRVVRREGFPAPGGTLIAARCELSQNKAVDCPKLP